MIIKKKKSKLQFAQERTQKAINNTNNKIEELGGYTAQLYSELCNIQECFDNIRNVPDDKALQIMEYKKVRLNWKQQAEKIERDFNAAIKKNAGAGMAGAGVGVAVVALGPNIAMGIATTFGVASTGTPIAALAGAAAHNAALAWLGGGALAVNGGGMAAGEGLLSLAGPVGWVIAAIAVVSSGLMLWKAQSDKKCIENVFVSISNRDIKSYELAIVEINERINRIVDETDKLREAIIKIETFGTDYDKMTEAQQYELGAYVNLMLSSTQLLINPILGLLPKYTEEDFNKYLEWDQKMSGTSYCIRHKDVIIAIANLIYKVYLNGKEIKLLWRTLRSNKSFYKSVNVRKNEFTTRIMYTSINALKYKAYLYEIEDNNS